MSGLACHITAREDGAFLDVRVENGFHRGVGRVLRPSYKMVNGLLRPVGVIYFNLVSFFSEFIARFAQCGGGFFGDEGHGFFVTINARADEIVFAMIPNIQYGVLNGVGEEAEAVRHGFQVRFGWRVLFCYGRREFLLLRLSFFARSEYNKLQC